MIELNIQGEIRRFRPETMINAGYTSRDREAIQEHIDEIAEEGIPEPERIPATYQVSPDSLIVDPQSIQAVGENTSGEAEFGLVLIGDEIYVVAASDHTDRDLEKDDIQKSKQVTPNIVSRRAWPFEKIEDHWDAIQIRAWSTIEGERQLYQSGTLEEIRPPKDIIAELSERDLPLDNTVLLCGTIATKTGSIEVGTRFEVEMYDPELDRSIGIDYEIDAI